MKNELGLKIIDVLSLDKKLLRFSREQKIKNELNTLYFHSDNGWQRYREHLAKKIGYTFLSVCGIGVLFMAFLLSPKEDKQLNGYSISRNGYNETEKTVYLTVISEDMEEEIVVQIEPLHYSKSELDKMVEEACNKVFDKNFIGQEGVLSIKEDLDLPTVLEGYPFSISWESSNYNVLDENGAILSDVSEKGESVTLTAQITCYDYVWEKEYSVIVYPKEESWEQSFVEKVTESIETIDGETAENSELYLPEEIDGHEIVYEEEKDNTVYLLLGLWILVLGLLWVSMDNQIGERIKERNVQLLADYAGLVSKLSLYLGAGVSFRNALVRIVQNADKDRFYVKELEVVLRELENGIAEYRAVEGLGERCKVSCYVKLSVLLNQNMRKGNNSLLQQLKEEADKAFEERKNLARKYAQEAGTKLLFPMLLMLLVVMVMIMYPAFTSFTV